MSSAEPGRPTARASSWAERWLDLLLQPRWAAAAAGLLLVAGIVAGAFDGSSRGRELARDRYVSSVNPSIPR